MLAEIGEASHCRRAAQITRLAGLDSVVDESGETRQLYWTIRKRREDDPKATATVAWLTVVRKIGKRAYHSLRELELAAT